MNEQTGMTPELGLHLEIEPERYEFFEGPAYRFDLDRRGFLKAMGGGILVLCLLDREADDAEAQPPGGGRRRGGGSGGPAAPQDLGAWLHVGEDGKISVYTGKAEVGQNIRTSLSQVVAEELRAPIESIHMVMADTQLTPYDMGTFGSRTTPAMAPQLRRAAAAARELLIDLAAETWKVDRAELSVADGAVVRAKGRETLPFGKLTHGRKLTKAVSGQAPTTPADAWKVAGQSVAKVDGRSFVTGKHEYASDVRLPGMWHGKVLRPPSYGAKLTALDDTAARAMKDVVVVRDGDFVAVAAPSEFQASRALAALKAEWKPGPAISGKDLFTVLKQPARPAQGGRGGGGGYGGGSGAPTGSIEAGLKAADVRLKESYTVAYIAHAPLEPRAAVAKWEDGKLTVWTGSQGPFRVRGELTGAFGLPDDKVRVIVPDTGSGYGGKHTVETAVEAARLAREAGRPVKVVWTREEEFTWAYFRPAGVIDIVSGVKKDGTLTAWEFHNYNSGGSGIRTPYEVPNQVSTYHASNSPLRQGSYRSLAATANHFARESHMDELAHALHLDPLDFRLKNLGKREEGERLRAVLEAAAKAFGWGRKLGSDRGCGIALGLDKGGYVATCAEVAVDRPSGRVQVVRAVSAFDCGAIVNPDHLKNQVEGALIMGLGGAMTEAIEFRDGKILNPKFSKYRVPRFRDAPEIEVVLLDRKDLPSAGAGETPIVGIAPAVGNAIFDAVGIRLRSMPMVPQGLKL
jgi:isoquinoline 1-oxidoreductase